MSASLPQTRPSFLIVCLRLVGDVLLSTPLALSIKSHLPDATVDYLVFNGTEGALAKNPHVRRVHTVSDGLSGLWTFTRLWRRYDYSIGTNASDRTAIFCSGTGRRSIGFVLPERKHWWKRVVLSNPRNYDGSLHTVAAMLSQLEVLGIPPVARVVLASDGEDTRFVDERLGAGNFILLHPLSKRDYKYWPAAAWARLAEIIRAETSLRAVFSMGVGAADQEQLAKIRLAAGKHFECFPEPFTFTQIAAAIRKCQAFVGVDTAVTHLAAALEVPVVALFGPSPADRWGPWPNGSSSPRPYARAGGTQRQGRITILQPDWPCVPCDRETCGISKRNKIECLEELSPETVLRELKRLMAT